MNPTTFTIDDRTYTTRLMPASEALLILPRLIRLFGQDLLAMLLDTEGNAAKIEALLREPEVLGRILHVVAVNASELPGGLLVLRDLMAHTTCKQVRTAGGVMELPVSDNFDEHFAGDLMHLLRVAMKVAAASFTKPSAA